MKRFFDDMPSLHRFTMNLALYQDSLCCGHCEQRDQFVSHGFVYKEPSGTDPIGKRIICTNRFGKQGCGHTVRLYLSTAAPRHQYTAIHLFLFLSALMTGQSIDAAYHRATGASDTRNGHRWTRKLCQKLTTFRSLATLVVTTCQTLWRRRSRQLQLLLATLQSLFTTIGVSSCAGYQHTFQQDFI